MGREGGVSEEERLMSARIASKKAAVISAKQVAAKMATAWVAQATPHAHAQVAQEQMASEIDVSVKLNDDSAVGGGGGNKHGRSDKNEVGRFRNGGEISVTAS
eukprot:6187501-Pleurochrysis_carterae.AAC.3